MAAYLEEYFYAVDKKEDDHDEHEPGVAAIEDVGVVLNILQINHPMYPIIQSNYSTNQSIK